MERIYRTSSVVFMPGGLLMDTAAKRDTNHPEEGEAARRAEEQRFSDPALSSAEVERQARVFNALGNETRLSILQLLLDRGETCVSDIVEGVGGAASTIAHHLRTLEDAELILSRRHGRSTYYTVRKEELAKYHVFEQTLFNGGPSA